MITWSKTIEPKTTVDGEHQSGINLSSSTDWSNITSKPTTLAGYGITDAYTKTYIDTNFQPAGSYLTDHSYINELSGVSGTETAGNVLYNNGVDTWIMGTLAAAGIEPAIGAKNSGFNLALGTGAGQVAEGNHTHSYFWHDLNDLDITTPAAGEILAFQTADILENRTLAEAGIAPTTHFHSVASLTDTNIETLTANEVLQYDGGDWRNRTFTEANIADRNHNHTGVYKPDFTENNAFNRTFGTSGSSVNVARADHTHTGYLTEVWLNDIQDVTMSAPANGEILMQIATDDWRNQTLAEAGIEPAIGAKNTAFNKNFGTLGTEVAYGNHNHDYGSFTGDMYYLYELNGVTITSEAVGELLVVSGSDTWHNRTLAEAGVSAVGHTHSNLVAGNGLTGSTYNGSTGYTWSVASHAGSAGTIGTINVGANTIGVNLGSTSTTAAPGNHNHTGVYKPDFSENTGFNLVLGTGAGQVAEGNHTHLLAAGATDVTASAAEVNLLNLVGLSVGQVLAADSATSASWQNPIDSILKRASLRTTDTTTDFATGAAVAIDWDATPDFIDTDVFTHSTGTNPSRLEVEQSGVYSFNANIGWTTNQTGQRMTLRLYFRVNGTTTYEAAASRAYHRGTTYGNAAQNSIQDISLSANDYIEVMVISEYQPTYIANLQIAYCDFSAKLATTTAAGNTWRPNASVSSLSDTTITSIATGELLKWSGTAWINNTLAEAGISASTHNHDSTYLHVDTYISELNGVTITSIASGEILVSGGVETWTNKTLAEAGISATGHTHTFASLTSKPTTLSGFGITDGQPLDGDLTAIAALGGSSGLLRKTAVNTWTLDTSNYLTDHSYINELSGVSGAETSGNVLYATGVDTWVMGTLAAAGIQAAGVPVAHDLNEHDDVVSATTPTTGNLLRYNGANWSDYDFGYSDLSGDIPYLHELSGVTITSEVSGEILRCTGSDTWANNTLTEAGISAVGHGHSNLVAGNGITGSTYTGTVGRTWSIASHAGTAGSIGTINIGANTVGVSLGTTSTTAAAGNHTHTTWDRASSVLSGANVFSNIIVTNGITTGISTRALTAANIGAATSGHQHTAFDYVASDLSGAVVFDNLDVTNGIVTAVGTRSLTAANIGAAPSKPTVLTTKTTGFTLVAGDNEDIIPCSGTFTVTMGTSLGAGFNCQIINIGTGTITFAAGGTTLNSDGTKLADQYSGASVIYRGTNISCVFGKLTT